MLYICPAPHYNWKESEADTMYKQKKRVFYSIFNLYIWASSYVGSGPRHAYADKHVAT